MTEMEPENSTGNSFQAVPFLAVSDIKSSLRFYVDGLGFAVARQWIDAGAIRWCRLERGGAALMLQDFQREGGKPWSPPGPLGLGVSILFICDDAVAIWREATRHGIQASRPFVGNGMWVTSLRDPDGYRIEFESATEAPEETEFCDDTADPISNPFETARDGETSKPTLETVEQCVQRLVSEEVEIATYDPAWAEAFTREKQHLLSCLPGDLIRRIEHFGSTAVPGLSAKPVVDMLIEGADLEATKVRIAPVLESLGYEYLWRPTFGDDGPPFYAWFIKRDPRTGARTHHLHMVERCFTEHWDRLLFRDYLIDHPEVAGEYQALKIRLAAASRNDRVAYSQGKTRFISEVTDRARRYYQARKRILDLDESWKAAAERRDLEAMLAIYAPDAQELLPGLPPVVGRQAIRDLYRGLIERHPRFAHHFDASEVRVADSGDLAVVRGSFRFVPDTQASNRFESGKFIGVWRFREADWRLQMNISNSDPAPSAGGSAAS